MSAPITVDLESGVSLELRLTPYRTTMLRDLTGIDILAGVEIERGDYMKITSMYYALAGGEKHVGMTLEDFSDAVAMSELQLIAAKVSELIRRDFPDKAGVEGNASRPAKGQASTTSRSGKPRGASTPG